MAANKEWLSDSSLGRDIDSTVSHVAQLRNRVFLHRTGSVIQRTSHQDLSCLVLAR